MSVRQDRFTFFGVLVAVVIVVIGYLQLSRLYPVAGRGDSVVQQPNADTTKGTGVDPGGDSGAVAGEAPGEAPREGEPQP